MTSTAVAQEAARRGGQRRILTMVGAPGAGKGTQAERLAEILGLPHVSTGELFRELTRTRSTLADKVRGIIKAGALVPDSIVVQMVEERLREEDAAEGAILDGFPRTVAQARALDEMLRRAGAEVAAALYIEVAPELLLERLTGRRVCTVDDQHVYHVVTMPPKKDGICDIDGAELRQRDDDKPETVQERLDKQLPPMFEVVDHYAEQGVLFPVRGTKPAAAVTEDLLRALATAERDG